ncbi:MAG TPA: hypothetical protein VIV34_04425 [Pseudolabrys sp.]
MPTIDGAFINGLLSTPLVMPASVAGGLAALFFVLVVIAVQRAASGGGTRLLLPLGAIVIAALAVIGILDRMATNERTAEQRALLERHTQLSLAAVAPGSPLACLDGAAGEQIENACEKTVFADAQSAASAVVYIGARLSLLSDISAAIPRGNPELQAVFASTRRAIELDRYGIAAHVLAVRDGCTAERCPAFALFQDTGALKANLKVHAFDTYVGRYAPDWGKREPAAVPQAAVPAPSPVASAGTEAPSVGHPVDSRYDFPSAASIPPVSIMNAEPAPPKEQAAAPGGAVAADKAAGNPPVPPKRPQAQAATPPAR